VDPCQTLVAAWGRDYAISPLRDRSISSAVRIRLVAGDDPVQLAFDGINPPLLCPGRLEPRAVCDIETRVLR